MKYKHTKLPRLEKDVGDTSYPWPSDPLIISCCHSGRSPSPRKILFKQLFLDAQFKLKSFLGGGGGERKKKREALRHGFHEMQHAMLMPLWGLFSGQPRWASLSSLGEAASLKSSLLSSSESLMRALFLKWSPGPQSSFRCLISPTLHNPRVCFESLPPPAPQRGSRDYTTALLSTVLLFWEEVIAYSARLVPFSSFLIGFLGWSQVRWCIGRVGGEERTKVNIIFVNTDWKQRHVRCIITLNFSSLFSLFEHGSNQQLKFCQSLRSTWKMRGLVLSPVDGLLVSPC